ncbi:MAG: hypothetical protein WCK73_14865 [Deltaproteobacteria bacterium]
MSPSSPTPDASGRDPGLSRSAWLLFAAFLVAFSAAVPRYAWNEASRAALVAAVVEQGTFAIDAYANGTWNTGDRAVFRGHTYSDKIIGVSLLALPGYAAAKLVAGGHDRPPPTWLAFLSMRLFAETLPGAAGAVLLFLLLVRLGTPEWSAVLATVFSIVGTMWLGYGTTLYPYVPGMTAILAALHLTLFPPRRSSPVLVSLLVGALLGGALILDYVFGIAAALLGFARLWLAASAGRRDTGGRQVGVALGHGALVAAGALPFLALFAAYCHAIFGEFSIPYRFLENRLFREGMARGVMGIAAPSLDALWFITVHPFRGIFFWSPVVAVAWWGCVARARRGDPAARVAGWLGLVALPAYLLFNSAYYMWWGGFASGPRFVLPALPLVLPGLGALARDSAEGRGRAGWVIARAAGWISVALCIPIALHGVNAPQVWSDERMLGVKAGMSVPLPHLYRLRDFYSGTADLLSWPVVSFVAPRWAGYAAAAAAALAFSLLVLAALRATRPRPAGSRPR